MVIAGLLATAVTLILPALQAGGWVSEHAVWILWVGIAALLIVMIFLVARLAAVKEDLTSAIEATFAAGQQTKEVAQEAQQARADLEDLRTAARQAPTPGLGKLDQGLADQLLEYSSDTSLLTTLGSFFPYQIPMEPVRLLEELAELPTTRTAYNEALNRHLEELAESARLWLEKLAPVSTIDGGYYSTKLHEVVSQNAYQQHAAMTDELGRTGFELHSKLLAYQKYYASLRHDHEV